MPTKKPRAGSCKKTVGSKKPHAALPADASLTLRLPRRLIDAARSQSEARGISLQANVRRLLADQCNLPEFADSLPPGNPEWIPGMASPRPS